MLKLVNIFFSFPLLTCCCGEFEGNDSWGYNVSHHNALDKAYGTIDSFKTFVDECHQRGIAFYIEY